MTRYTLSLDGATVVGFGASGPEWTPTLSQDKPDSVHGWLDLADDDSRIAAYIVQGETANKIAKAKIALAKTDDVAIRCLKAGVSFTPDWQAFVAALRLLIATGEGDLPAQPIGYPLGS